MQLDQASLGDLGLETYIILVFKAKKSPDVHLDGVIEAADKSERLTGGLPPAARALVLLGLGLVQQSEAEAGLSPEI